MGHSVGLRKIETVRIIPDPDVQFDWTYTQRALERLGRYDADIAGVIDVVPLNGHRNRAELIEDLVAVYGEVFRATPQDGPLYGSFVGRHRNLLARYAGIGEMRCDVHEGLSVVEKHQIKLAKDRNRRKVTPVELFQNETGACDPISLAIQGMTYEHGWKIGHLKGGKPYDTFQCVVTLRQIYQQGNLAEVFALGQIWFGQPKTNSAYWLNGLNYAINDGWVERLSRSGRERLAHVIPLKVVSIAIAESPKNWPVNGAAEGISEYLRKYGNVRRQTRR